MRSTSRALLPHETLLLACAREGYVAAASPQVEAALSLPNLDWRAAVLTSIQHGIAPTLSWHLRALPELATVPREIRSCLTRITTATESRNAVIFRETARLLKALEAAGIRCLILKGVALSLSVYPEHGLRNFADIDLLVEPSDWEAAGAVAETCGCAPDDAEVIPHDYHRAYTLQAPEDILTGTLAAEFEPLHGSEAVLQRRHAVALEIHRNVFRLANNVERGVSMDSFWERPTRLALPDGTKFYTPGPEVTLVHLAVHAGSHAYNRLLFPLDIRQVVEIYGSQIDWDRVRMLSHSYGAQQDLMRVLGFAQRELGAAVPERVLQQEGMHSAEQEAPLQAADIFIGMQLAIREKSTITWSRLLQEQTPWARVVTIWQILFPSPSAMRRFYETDSALLVALWYLMRPFQLSGRFVRMMARIARARLSR